MDYQNYMIGYLDSLGQGAILRRFGLIQEADKQELERVLHAAIVHIHGLRRVLARFYEKAEAPSDFVRDLPEAEKDRLRALRQGAGYYRAFSDALLLYVPVNGDDELRPSILGVWRAVLAGAVFLGASLADGKPMRGGMDIGLGVDLSQAAGGVGSFAGEIYGPALAHAYRLESKIAQYPRIVVGDSMCRWLDAVTRNEELNETPDGRVCLHFARRTLEFITVDPTDSLRIVDFMGPAVRDMGALPQPAVVLIYAFALSELRSAQEGNDEELIERYTNLLAYCRPRLALWGLTP